MSIWPGQVLCRFIPFLLAVNIVLGILYESLVHPRTIISRLPSASVGAMLALLLFQQDLNVRKGEAARLTPSRKLLLVFFLHCV